MSNPASTGPVPDPIGRRGPRHRRGPASASALLALCAAVLAAPALSAPSRHAPAGALVAAAEGVAGLAVASEALAPAAFEADYSVRYLGTELARSHWRLERTGDARYRLEVSTEPVGLGRLVRREQVEEVSEFHVLEDGSVRPHHYRYQRIRGERDRDIEARFDHAGGVIALRYGADHLELPLPADSTDSASYLVALMTGLRRGQESFEFPVLEAQKQKTYTLERAGGETLDTAAGRFDTVLVRRVEMKEAREQRFFCAADLDFLPVRIEHREAEGYGLVLELQNHRRLPAEPGR